MQRNTMLEQYKIDPNGDFLVGINLIIWSDAYYPGTTETYNGGIEILFAGLKQGTIFSLCVEGYV